jgi:hypothetical protein
MPNKKKSKQKGKAADKSGSVVGNNDLLWLGYQQKDVKKVKAAIAAGADVNHISAELSCLPSVVAIKLACSYWLLVPTRKQRIRIKASRR